MLTQPGQPDLSMLVKQSMGAPAMANGEEEMLARLVAQASATPPGAVPYVAPAGASYSQGLQQNPNLDNKVRIQKETEDLMRRAMMEEIAKPPPALPQEVKAPGALKKKKRPAPALEE